MARFPHLEIRQIIDGLYNARGVPQKRKQSETTLTNLQNRQAHGTGLLQNVDHLAEAWASKAQTRKEQNLPDLPDADTIPLFLQIDPKEFEIESLQSSFGIEIISEEENGFIIGASSVDFKSLKEKIDIFLKNEDGRKFQNKAAQLWQIVLGEQWRLEQILSEELATKWSSINDTDILIVDLGIACYKRIPKQPAKKEDDTEEKYQLTLQKWREKKYKQERDRDEVAIKRQDDLENLVYAYEGEFLSSYVEFDDSFSCRIKISGKGLKDIVLTYQYLFEVTEHDPLAIVSSNPEDLDGFEPELVPPPSTAPKICIIDSGIQEEHRLLAPAIDSGSSMSFIEGDDSAADIASGGGHGTRVAGAVLYPYEIPKSGSHQIPFILQNARVLIDVGGTTSLPNYLYPPELMEDIVENFDEARIFNLSINSFNPCKLIHMSQWASTIDKLMFDKRVLFILSAGNLFRESGVATRPGIKDHLRSGRQYPNYLLHGSSRIANPSQSCFAITVGSICITKFENDEKESFGAKDYPSSFSRTGLGLWNMIKPDLVEYGGDFAKEKNTNPNILNEPSISPELVRSTYHSGSAVGRDSVGTSFAAPKVTHIAAHLQRLYPDESPNLYRALLVQSARLPDFAFANPNQDHIRHYGYGIPNLQRAVENSEKRITLIASGAVSAKQANLYSIKVPEQLKVPGQDFDILIEVTLSFMARPRRTRRRTNSYLSTWLHWESSKLNEGFDQFASRILKDAGATEELEEDQNVIKWIIRERTDWSKIEGLRRQDSSLQKSWCIMKSYNLPSVLSLAVIGHKGWECDLSEQIPYSIAVSFEALTGNINVYEMIRVENQIELPVEAEVGVEILV